MKDYSIVRVGNAYVVQADHKSILKIASKRSAVRLVAQATELLQLQAAPPLAPDADTEPSITRDGAIGGDPSEAS